MESKLKREGEEKKTWKEEGEKETPSLLYVFTLRSAVWYIPRYERRDERRYVGRWSVTGGELRDNRSPEAPLRHDDAVQRCIAVKKLQTRGRPGLAFRAHIDPSLGLSRAKKIQLLLRSGRTEVGYNGSLVWSTLAGIGIRSYYECLLYSSRTFFSPNLGSVVIPGLSPNPAFWESP